MFCGFFKIFLKKKIFLPGMLIFKALVEVLKAPLFFTLHDWVIMCSHLVLYLRYKGTVILLSNKTAQSWGFIKFTQHTELWRFLGVAWGGLVVVVIKRGLDHVHMLYTSCDLYILKITFTVKNTNLVLRMSLISNSHNNDGRVYFRSLLPCTLCHVPRKGSSIVC